MRGETVSLGSFREGVRVRARHAIGSKGIGDGAEGRIRECREDGYVAVEWESKVEIDTPAAAKRDEIPWIHFEHLQVIEARKHTGNKTTSTSDEIECPHGCGHVHGDLWDYNWDGNNNEIITMCEECQKPITLHRELRVKYIATADKLGDDE